MEVCPVDCIHGPFEKDGRGEEVATLDTVDGLQLYIDPDECIDCGACEPECPVEAIVSDVNYEKHDKDKWLDINKKSSNLSPNIVKKKDPPSDADKYKNIKNKYDKYFSEKPGE